MPQALIDHSELVNRDHENLTVLMCRQMLGQITIKMAAVAQTGKAVRIQTAHLKIKKKNEVGHHNNAAVEQYLRIHQLKNRHADYRSRKDKHDPADRTADPMPVLQIAESQKCQIKAHHSIAQVDPWTPVIPLLIKAEDSSRPGIGQNGYQINSHNQAQYPGHTPQILTAVQMLQNGTNQIIGDQRTEQNKEYKILRVQQLIDP